MSLNQLARSVGLPFADKFDARSQRRREARLDRLAQGKAAAAASQRNQQMKKPQASAAIQNGQKDIL